MKIIIINHFKFDGQISENQPLPIKIQWLIDILNQKSSMNNPDIYVIQRASKNAQISKDNITTLYVKDSYGPNLRWCDNPEDLNQKIADLKPDIVHMFNLALPLHFRWLKNYLSNGTKLIGHHTGERIWVQLRLFLQQFGLRAADAFIFENIDEAKPFLKASVILPHQPIFEIPNSKTPLAPAIQTLTSCYDLILTSSHKKKSN
jgi:hypothetical protein